MQPISSTAFDTTLAHAADLDADGDADALSASTWHANELGVFSPASDLPRTGQGLIAMESADLDGDFDIDVVFASSSTVFWLENLGTEDCNGNGSPDSQDVATGISTDCNGNGVPDECELAADASLDLNHNAIFDPCEALGQRYCSPVFPNSTGLPGLMTALGTTAIFLDDLTLTARSLPNDSFGYFITSRTQGYVFPVGGSQGALCVLGLVGRYVGPGQIMSSGKTGSFTLPVSVSSMPTPSGVVVASPGETWNFQAWHRDVVGGSVTSNFSSGLSITFR